MPSPISSPDLSPLLAPKDPPDPAGSKADAGDEEKRKELIADWKFLDFEHFKNRYGPDEGLEIIEVLQGHQYLDNEIWKETQDRSFQGKSRSGSRKWKRKSKAHAEDNEAKHIQRIRIQSPALLLLLSRLTGNHNTWATDKPRVFFRPFRAHYYYLPQMKEVLAILEKKWGVSQPETAAADAKPRPAADGEDTPDHAPGISENLPFKPDPEELDDIDLEYVVSGDVADTLTALQHVRTYVEFVEKHVLPLWQEAQGTTKRKVTFFDLWRSFKPGEILYRPPATDSYKDRGETSSRPVNKMYQGAWRLYSMVLDRFSDQEPNDNEFVRTRDLDLSCYYIDYDGTSYLPVTKSFTIKDFEGERDITTLPIYPMRFAKDRDSLMEKFLKQGEHFHFIKTVKYLHYDGWTLTQGPTGTSDSKKLFSEHIDSGVVVDFVEGYRAESTLDAPSFEGLQTFSDDGWPAGKDEMEIRHWPSVDRCQPPTSSTQEKTQTGEWFGNYLRQRHLKENKFMRDWQSGLVTTLDPEDLVLLPRRAVAYAFRERKFILADIDKLREVRKQDDVFKDLKIDPNHKQMIESLVETHFQKQAIQKEFGTANLNQDLIRGKGSGLVLLLHGVPLVPMCFAYASAVTVLTVTVAEELGKPRLLKL